MQAFIAIFQHWKHLSIWIWPMVYIHFGSSHSISCYIGPPYDKSSLYCWATLKPNSSHVDYFVHSHWPHLRWYHLKCCSDYKIVNVTTYRFQQIDILTTFPECAIFSAVVCFCSECRLRGNWKYSPGRFPRLFSWLKWVMWLAVLL